MTKTSEICEGTLSAEQEEMSSPTILPPQSKQEGNGGSRESSEFEFVNVGGQRSHAAGAAHHLPAPSAGANPLLLSSNLPGSRLVTPPSVPGVPSQAMVSTPRPAPAASLPQSVSVPANIDQTAVATVVAESPPAPGECRGYSTSSLSLGLYSRQGCSAG